MFPMELLEPTLSYDRYFYMSRLGIMLVSFTASLFTLTHISIDRFMGIIFTMKYFVDSKRKRLYYTVICLIWITSVGVNSSLLWFSDFSSVKGMPCTNGAIVSFELKITIICGMFLLMIMNTFIYVAIGWKIAFRKGISNLNNSNIVGQGWWL